MGHGHAVKLLLDNNADIAVRSHDLLTPLGFAALSGREQVVRILLERGAARAMTQPEKMKSLYDVPNQAVVRLLMENNFDGTLHNSTSRIYTVVASGDTIALKHLLTNEVDINENC